MEDSTAGRTSNGITGGKKYQRRARRALPLLVRQAKAEQQISYSDLAEELGMPNPRNLNYVLGAIGNELQRLTEEWGVEVPPIQAVVINKNSRLPGDGIASFAPDAENFRAASKSRRKQIVHRMLDKVFAFNRWDQVLRDLDLNAVTGPAIQSGTPQPKATWGGPAESEAHRRFKEFVAANPDVVGLGNSYGPGETEYVFRSADAVDVLFRTSAEWVAVEVKASESPLEDIERGLFQCVKYEALLKATQRVQQTLLNARIILALQGRFPQELISLRNTLGIEVVDDIEARR